MHEQGKQHLRNLMVRHAARQTLCDASSPQQTIASDLTPPGATQLQGRASAPGAPDTPINGAEVSPDTITAIDEGAASAQPTPAATSIQAQHGASEHATTAAMYCTVCRSELPAEHVSQHCQEERHLWNMAYRLIVDA